jgi:hypothetical protein
LKHVIEPRWTYNYEGTFDNPQTIPLFDEVDFQSGNNIGTIALDNRFLAKPKDEKESAREILLIELSRSYSFDRGRPLLSGTVVPPNETNPNPQPLTSQQGPLDLLVRFNPTAGTSVKAEATYDTLFKHVAATSLSGNLVFSPGSTLGLTWFTSYLTPLGTKVSDQIGIVGGFEILPKRLHLDYQINYDANNRLLQLQRYVASWTSQCFGFQVELRDYRVGLGVAQQRTKDYRFSLSLKNVGTFLDLTGRTQSGF